MEKKPIKVLSKNRFSIIIFFILLFLLIDTLLGLKIIVKMHDNWYETTIGIMLVILFTVLNVGFFNSFRSKIYLYDDHLYIRSLFKKRKIFYKDLTELHFNSSSSPQSFYFALYGMGKKLLGIVHLQYVGKLHEQKDFIHFIKNHQPNIKLDKNCEKLLRK
jgi:hypothetical protein